MSLRKCSIVSLAAAALMTACSGEPAETVPEEETAVEEEAMEIEAEGPAISALLSERPALSTFAELMQTANLADSVDNARALTVLAPTNDAFDKLDEETRQFLMDEANAASLRGVLGYHLLRNDIASADLIARIEGGTSGDADLTTSNDYAVKAMVEDEELVLADAHGNRARISEADIAAANGSIHIIDMVLLPPEG